MLKPLVEEASRKAEVKKALGDGAYDSKTNFTYLARKGVKPGIKVRRDSRVKGCWSKSLTATEYLRDPEGWKRRVDYGSRWMAESAFSSLKRLFGEYVVARKYPNMVREMFLKAALYNLFMSLNPAT